MSTARSIGESSFNLRDPETFFEAQKRNRRATRRMTALCVVAAALMGVPLTLVLTPLLYALTLAAAEVINYFSPLSGEFWQSATELSNLVVRVADYLLNQHGTVDVNETATAVALIFLPGMVFTVLLWMGVLALFRHGGVGGTLASLNAREPNTSDLKELQLANVVQEMAVAAGLPAPRVMLIDSPGANAAAIGNCAEDARIVISRRLIDDLDRDELQAVLAHLIASVGNGDLRIAFTVTSVFETCGLIVALINAPFGRRSRSTLWKILGYALRLKRPAEKTAEAAEIAELLGDMLQMNSTDIERFFESNRPGLVRKLLRLALFPFKFTNIGIELTLWSFLHGLLGPGMALLWRTRRYLADAGSVELTRNPDALSRALQRLCQDNTAIAGSSWASHLFVMNPKGDASLGGFASSPEQQRKALAAWNAAAQPSSATVPTPDAVVSIDEYARMRKEMMATVRAAMTGDAAAAARLQAVASAIDRTSDFGLHDMPNFNDIALARRGDRDAIARLRVLHQTRDRSEQRRPGQTGLQAQSFVSFYPPLKRRAKRLTRMGAQQIAIARSRGGPVLKALMALVYIVAVPAFAFLAAMMLFLIAVIIIFNLVLLTLWLTVIHIVLTQDWGANFNAFMRFLDDVSRAIANARR
jgi:Zn-dependent protease with chaperone function